MTEIFDGIFLGNRYTARDAHFFQSNRITHVLNCTHDLKSFFENLSSVEQRIYQPSSPTSSAYISTASSDVGSESDIFDDNMSDTCSVSSYASDISSVSSTASDISDIDIGSSLGSMDSMDSDNGSQQSYANAACESNKENIPCRMVEQNSLHQYSSSPLVIGEKRVGDALLPMVKTPCRSVQLPTELLVTPVLLGEDSPCHSQNGAMTPSFKSPAPRSSRSRRKVWGSRKRRSSVIRRTPRKRDPNDYVTVKYDFAAPIQYMRIKTVDSMEQEISRWFDEGTEFIFEAVRDNTTFPNSKQQQLQNHLGNGEQLIFDEEQHDVNQNDDDDDDEKPNVANISTSPSYENCITKESDVSLASESIDIEPQSLNDTKNIQGSQETEDLISSSLSQETQESHVNSEEQQVVSEKQEESTDAPQHISERKPEHLPGFSCPNNRKCVLVHCREGRSRSVTMIVAFAMKRLGWSLKSAYDHVSEMTHGRIRINDGFKRQLMEYERELFGVNSLNFFPQRKRVRSYAEMTDADFEAELAADLDYIDQPRRKRQKTNHKRRRDKNLLPASAITKFFPTVSTASTKQITLFDMFAPKVKKETEPEKDKEKKPEKKQSSITSFFKSKPVSSTDPSA